MARPNEPDRHGHHLNKVFQDARELLIWTPRSLEDVKSQAIYVIDTSALTAPFYHDQQMVNELEKAYETLLKSGRVYFPSHVVREYFRIRPFRRAEMAKEASSLIGKVKVPQTTAHSIIKETPEFQDLAKIVEQIKQLSRDWDDQAKNLVSRLSDWTWQDPLTEMYRKVIPRALFEPQIDWDTLDADLDYRIKHRQPPGFEDKGKPDKGMGDLIVWQSVLQIGRQFDRDVVLVSRDEKADWYAAVDNVVYSPRAELVEEFRVASGGKSFHIISPGKFLELMNADPAVVDRLMDDVNDYSTPIRENHILDGFRALKTLASHCLSNEMIGSMDNDWVFYMTLRPTPGFTGVTHLVISPAFDELSSLSGLAAQEYRSIMHSIESQWDISTDRLVSIFVAQNQLTPVHFLTHKSITKQFKNVVLSTVPVSIALSASCTTLREMMTYRVD